MVKTYALAKENEPEPKSKIQAVPEKYGVKGIVVPVAISELNPIEMVWSCIKRKFAFQNMNFKLSEVEDIVKRVMDWITLERFSKYGNPKKI